MGLGNFEPGLVVDLDGVALGVERVHPKRVAVADDALGPYALVVEDAIEVLQVTETIDVER